MQRHNTIRFIRRVFLGATLIMLLYLVCFNSYGLKARASESNVSVVTDSNGNTTVTLNEPVTLNNQWLINPSADDPGSAPEDFTGTEGSWPSSGQITKVDLNGQVLTISNTISEPTKYGIVIQNGNVEITDSAGDGQILIDGEAGSNPSPQKPVQGVGGIYCSGSNTNVTINGADVNVNLTKPQAAGYSNFAVHVTDDAELTVTGDSKISGNPGIAVIASKSNPQATASVVVSGEATVTTNQYSGFSPIMTSPGDLGTPQITIENNASIYANSPDVTTYSGETAGIVSSAPNGIVTVNGGTVEGHSGIYVTAGSVDVTGGTVIGNGEYQENGVAGSGDNYGPNGSAIVVLPIEPAQETDQAKINISGGTFQSTNGYAVDIPQAANDLIPADGVEISGGEFSGKDNSLNLVPENSQGSVSGGTFNTPLDKSYLSPEVCVSVSPSGGTSTAYFASVKQAQQYITENQITNANIQSINSVPNQEQAQILALNVNSDGLLQYYNTNANATQKGDFTLRFTSIGTQASQLTPQQVNWSITPVASGTGSSIAFPQDTVWEQVGSSVISGNSISTTWELKALPPYENQVSLQYVETVSTTNNVDSYSFSDLALVYNGGTPQATIENGVYEITATAQQGWYNPQFTSSTPTDSLRFVVQSSTVESAQITLNGNEVSNPFTFDISNGRSVDFDYSALDSAGEEVNAASVVWSLGNVVGISGSDNAGNYAQLNTKTGNLTFIQSLPAGAYIELYCVVNGLNASPSPLLITTSGSFAAGELTGIEPVYNPVYTNADLYNLSDNVVTVPYNEIADNSKLSFTTDSQDVTIYDGQVIPNNSRFVGPVNIQASYQVDDDVYTTDFVVNFTKTAVPATGISAEEEMVFTLPDWNTQNVKAQLTPENTTEQPGGARTAYQYASDNNEVAIVDLYGNVTPIAPGQAQITSSYNGWSTTTNVTVREATPATSIRLEPESLNFTKIGDSSVLTCTLEPAGATGEVSWSSQDESIATVTPGENNTATVTATGTGTTRILATVGELSASAEVNVSTIDVVEIELDPAVIFLAPKDALNAQITSQQVNALLTPQIETADLVWSVADENIASVASDGTTAQVSAVAEGQTVLTVTSGTVSAKANVIVSSSPVVSSGVVLAAGSTPDEFTLIAQDVQPNPALSTYNPDTLIEKVSMFAWSSPNQSDIHAINSQYAGNTGGLTDAAEYEARFSVNTNGSNNYFENADKIYINVYALSQNGQGEGNLIFANNALPYKSVNENTVLESGAQIAYIGYLQNIGFQQPTVYDGAQIGTTGEARPMEGVRVSSNIDGVQINTRVHIQNIGWVDTVSDGVYAGTIDRALGIEAVEFTLAGEKASNYRIEYRAHVKNIGWQDWVSTGQTAGTTGQNLGIEAMEIRLIPN